jgi:hypothetical protein
LRQARYCTTRPVGCAAASQCHARADRSGTAGEGKISYYSALELNVAERLGKAFEAKYPDISIVERFGAERIY